MKKKGHRGHNSPEHGDGCGCREYSRLSRRQFLGSSGSLMALAAVPAWLPRVVLADSDSSDRDVIVSLFLRGGADGLSLCVPHGEQAYYDLRRALAVAPPDSNDPNRAVDLDGFFGLPPGMTPLIDLYRENAVLFAHAVGQQSGTRSHFAAMRFMELGHPEPPPDLITGWLGRHLQATAPTLAAGLIRALAIGTGLPLTLAGAPRTLPVENPADFSLQGNAHTAQRREDTIRRMYRSAPGILRSASRNIFDIVALLDRFDFAGYRPSGAAEYPASDLGQALRSTAALIKAEIGVEAVAVDTGGWDTHEAQGPVDGTLAGLMNNLSSGLAALYEDLTAGGFNRFTIVVMSEFGRNTFENASGGTDHGHGGLMTVLGPNVRGGRVLTRWPGLEPEQLYEGQDLDVTIDYRDILTEILTKRLGNVDFRSVFSDPNFTPIDHGVVR